jgi:uncharacterized protein DUF6912
VRIYLPATTTMLAQLVDSDEIGPPPLTAFAVTAGLREFYVDNDDDEELEYAALVEAARASLRLIDGDESAARRRVVLAAEVPDAQVDIRDDIDRGVVQVTAVVPMSSVASAHVDDAAAEETVAAAAEAVIAADLGDPGSQDAVDDAEGYELSWYASQEIGALLELL